MVYSLFVAYCRMYIINRSQSFRRFWVLMFFGVNPKPKTQNPKPKTLNPKPKP